MAELILWTRYIITMVIFIEENLLTGLKILAMTYIFQKNLITPCKMENKKRQWQ